MSLQHVDCVILCGGKATRVASFLPFATAKSLFAVAGRPLLDHIIRHLRQHGARRIILATAHFAAAHAAWAVGRPDGLVLSVEEAPIGTVNSLKLAKPYLQHNTTLVCNGDTLSTIDLVQFFRDWNMAAGYARATQWPCAFVGDSGFRLFNRASLDKMIASGAKNIEEFVVREVPPVDCPGDYFDIGNNARALTQAEHYISDHFEDTV